MDYFGVFFVLTNYVWFPAFYAKIPYFNAHILYPSLYLHMTHPSVIREWRAYVA